MAKTVTTRRPPWVTTPSSSASDDLHHLGIAEDVMRILGPREDGIHEDLVRLDAPQLQPIGDVRGPRHVADADFLLAAERPGRDARINAIGEPCVAFRLRLDDGGCVHAG